MDVDRLLCIVGMVDIFIFPTKSLWIHWHLFSYNTSLCTLKVNLMYILVKIIVCMGVLYLLYAETLTEHRNRKKTLHENELLVGNDINLVKIINLVFVYTCYMNVHFYLSEQYMWHRNRSICCHNGSHYVSLCMF